MLSPTILQFFTKEAISRADKDLIKKLSETQNLKGINPNDFTHVIGSQLIDQGYDPLEAEITAKRLLGKVHSGWIKKNVIDPMRQEQDDVVEGIKALRSDLGMSSSGPLQKPTVNLAEAQRRADELINKNDVIQEQAAGVRRKLGRTSYEMPERLDSLDYRRAADYVRRKGLDESEIMPTYERLQKYRTTTRQAPLTFDEVPAELPDGTKTTVKKVVIPRQAARNTKSQFRDAMYGISPFITHDQGAFRGGKYRRMGHSLNTRIKRQRKAQGLADIGVENISFGPAGEKEYAATGTLPFGKRNRKKGGFAGMIADADSIDGLVPSNAIRDRQRYLYAYPEDMVHPDDMDARRSQIAARELGDNPPTPTPTPPASTEPKPTPAQKTPKQPKTTKPKATSPSASPRQQVTSSAPRRAPSGSGGGSSAKSLGKPRKAPSKSNLRLALMAGGLSGLGYVGYKKQQHKKNKKRGTK